MILVVGGTGRLGGLVADDLQSSGHEVRVLSRGLHAARPGRPGIDVVLGDVRDQASVDAAMQGVDVVVSTAQGFVGPGGVTPASVDRDGNVGLVEAAARHGADVVLLSLSGAAADAPWELGRMKFAAEQSLAASGCAGTVIRPAAFVQTWLDVLRASAARGRRPRVLGRGDNPIPWVDVHEVAALVVRAVGDPALRGRVLDLAGPEPLTLLELAAAMMAGLGWAGTPQRVPRAAVRLASATVGLARPQVRRICLAALAMDEMRYPDDHQTRLLIADLASTPASELAGSFAATGRK
jgi:uncharacterized protein YbjT (DUF2867 family)